jgi:hypothetical protein
MEQDRLMLTAVVLAGLCIAGCKSTHRARQSRVGAATRRISVEEYVDKVKAGWLGQMAGVGWGASTEFKYNGVIIPKDSTPRWTPQMVNQFQQDDLYVEMTFLQSLDAYGLDVSAQQAGVDFASTGYPLWHANRSARDNLRAGIAPPDSGHPRFNPHADDIDFQIESDFAGLIAPGMPAVAVQLGEKFGRIMNYGDGLYGGQFVAGMYTEAFFESDPLRIVEAGLSCIPQGSQYYQCINDVLRWHHTYPDDWTRVWYLIDEKYRLRPAYRRFSCSDVNDTFDIDAKLNGAYVVMGLLYGQGDPDETITIATRCGQDSDCNPSTAAGILFTTIGFRSLPEKFKIALDPWGKFGQTQYNFPTLIDVCERLARQAVTNCGGKTVADSDGREYFVIPAREPRLGPLEQSWDPQPPMGSRYDELEMAAMTPPIEQAIVKAVHEFAPGWEIANCGQEFEPGLYPQLRGRRNVLVTSPLNPFQGCVLSKTIRVPAAKKSALKLVVGHDPRGDWDLIVAVNGQVLLRKAIGLASTHVGWAQITVDLSQYAGRSVDLQLVNQPTGWHFEAAYWAEISVESK